MLLTLLWPANKAELVGTGNPRQRFVQARVREMPEAPEALRAHNFAGYRPLQQADAYFNMHKLVPLYNTFYCLGTDCSEDDE